MVLKNKIWQWFFPLMIISLLIFPESIAFAGFMEALARWDPIGKRFLEPIEDRVTGLDIKGFIQNRTVFDLHDNSHDDLNLPRVGNDLQTSQFLNELEINYQSPAVKWLAFTGIFHFLYDSAWDWDAEFEKAYKDQRKEFELQHYRTEKRLLRELYLDISLEDWQIRLGKQQVIWGKVDGRKVLDVINPNDSREFGVGAENWEHTRLTTWMANFNYFWKDYELQYLFIPDFEEELGAQTVFQMNRRPPSPTARTHTFRVDRPNENLENAEHAIKFGFLKGEWETDISYFYTWDDSPTRFRRATLMPRGRPTPQNPIQIFFEPKHTRLHQFGLTNATSFDFMGRQWTTRIEALYTSNKYITIDDPNDLDGQAKKDTLLTSVQIGSLVFVDWNWSLTWVQTYTFGWNSRLRTLPIRKPLDRMEYNISMNIFKSFYNDRASYSTLFLWGEDGEWRIRPSLKYSLTDFLNLELRGHYFTGNSDDFIGQFEKMSNVEIGITYSF